MALVNFPQKCLIIFTRYPESGQTKTRLIPALGADGAAKLQRLMTKYAILQAQQLQSNYPVNIEVHYSGGNSQLMSDWLGKNLIYKPQVKGDIGVKMSMALATAFSQGYKSVVIIGTDCPSLDRSIIKQAFDLLEGTDVVLGSAADGGYYLIGLNKLIPELFRSVEWSTSKVFNRTVEIASQLHLKISYLPTLFDIDRPEDLEFLKNNPAYQQILSRTA
ncbi:TIGR04282 family arsenosugar biosynthesis glycosyltransferase [Merismopedia glauca]|uniref:Glycosyltransferase n=1 Tax=Merismopedia glauca CCAP 1448/3 TaxID=1296344 RepID=A0A2T1C0N6_9CYAN|nr:TIGR04282 family arsenosugar biosynthesis glycosyltransferase [Merismopedia glauca]PSB01764.1 hypothetical protein C7B64_16575 [Merismopedia glauca CCAP 1448/3]